MNKSSSIAKIKKIIDRVAQSNFNDSDIEVLFVTAREISSNSKRLFEVGSFVAHNNARDKGIINETLSRGYYLLNLQFGMDRLLVDVNRDRYPAYLQKFIKLQLQILDDNIFREALGIKGQQLAKARKLLSSTRAYQIDGDVCTLSACVGEVERKLVQNIITHLVVNPIKYEDLFLELINTLRVFFDVEQLEPLYENKKNIYAVLLCLMNGVEFEIEGKIDGQTTIETRDRKVFIGGGYTLRPHFHPGEVLTMISPVFEGDYNYDEIFCNDITPEDILNHNIEFSSRVGKIILKR